MERTGTTEDALPGLNLEALREIRDRIRDGEDGYDQGRPYGGCGTAYCIAGHAFAISPEGARRYRGTDAEKVRWTCQRQVAKDLLRLSPAETEKLFATHWPEHWLETVDPGAAERRLRPHEIYRRQLGRGPQGVQTFMKPNRRQAVAVLDWLCAQGRFPTESDRAGARGPGGRCARHHGGTES